ncbi:MAG: hypothetical protein Q7S47_03050 [bacterium]|nr:hypothetical protein [bacterium]
MATLLHNTKIGQCVYCFEVRCDLSDEHIVPFALNGRWILQKASCQICSKITSLIERNVCRELLAPTRAYFKFQTRRPKDRPTHFPLTIERSGKESRVMIPIEEYGAVTTFTTFDYPARFLGKTVEGIVVTGQLFNRIGGMDPKELSKKYGTNVLGFPRTYKPTDFAKLLAKIAYGFTVGYFGLGAIEDAYVLPALLNKIDSIGNWVGMSDRGLIKREDIGVEIELVDKEIIVRIQFFGLFDGSPTYMVLVGRIK